MAIDEIEYNKIMRLVADINLLEPNAIKKFSKWKNEDGTLEGLLEVFPYLQGDQTK